MSALARFTRRPELVIGTAAVAGLLVGTGTFALPFLSPAPPPAPPAPAPAPPQGGGQLSGSGAGAAATVPAETGSTDALDGY